MSGGNPLSIGPQLSLPRIKNKLVGTCNWLIHYCISTKFSRVNWTYQIDNHCSNIDFSKCNNDNIQK